MQTQAKFSIICQRPFFMHPLHLAIKEAVEIHKYLRILNKLKIKQLFVIDFCNTRFERNE